MSLAEIREAVAPPDTAAIYAGLRQGVGVAQVNLIWRHAAALPGVLEWLWRQARPAFESGAAAGARDRIAARIPVPAMPRMAPPAEVATLVETYNRGNLTNLAVLTAIRRRVEGETTGAPGPSAPIGAALPPPPPLPHLAELPAPVAETARRLAALHDLSDARVMPSLYLHLALWPKVLAAVPATLAPLFADGGLVRARDAAVAAAEAEAPGLIGALGPAAAAPSALGEFLRTLRTFTREVIPGMIPVGLCLDAAIGARG